MMNERKNTFATLLCLLGLAIASWGSLLAFLPLSPPGANGMVPGIILTLPKPLFLALGALLAAIGVVLGGGSLRPPVAVLGVLTASLLSWMTAGFTIAFGGSWLLLVLPAWPLFAAARFALEGGDGEETRRRAATKLLLVLFVLPASVLASSAVLEAATQLMPTIAKGRPGTVAGSRHILAAITSAALLLSVSLDWKTLSRRISFLSPLVVAILSVATLLTRSRVAWWAVLVCFAFMVVSRIVKFAMATSRTRAREARPGSFSLASGSASTALLVVAIVSAGLGAAIQWPGLSWRASQGNPYADTLGRMTDVDAGTGADRVSQWKLGLEMFKSSPVFGAGAGQWRRAAPAFANRPDGSYAEWTSHLLFPDSDFLRLAAEMGFAGAAIVAIAVATSLGIPGSLGLSMGLFFLIVCLGDATVLRAHFVPLFAMGLAASTARSISLRPPKASGPLGVAFVALSAVVLLGVTLRIVAIVLLGWGEPPLSAEDQWRKWSRANAVFPMPNEGAHILEAIPFADVKCDSMGADVAALAATLPGDYRPILIQADCIAAAEGEASPLAAALHSRAGDLAPGAQEWPADR